MQFYASATDNPDQRISEDLKLFVDETLSLSLGLLNAVVTLLAFVGHPVERCRARLEFSFAGQQLLLPRLHGVGRARYALAGTWLADKIGRPLIGLNFNQQRYEADFRFNLVRFRENMEGVALYRGEEDEMRGFRGRFALGVRELVEHHAPPEDAQLLSHQLQPGRGRVPLSGRRRPLLFRRDSSWAA